MTERDGFVIREIETGKEIHFMPSTKDGSQRLKVADGLAMRVDFEQFYFEDTREEAEST